MLKDNFLSFSCDNPRAQSIIFEYKARVGYPKGEEMLVFIKNNVQRDKASGFHHS